MTDKEARQVQKLIRTSLLEMEDEELSIKLGLMPPAPPVSARSAAGSGPRPAKATRPDAARDPALWDLLRTLKAHDKESRLLRKLLEQTHGLGSSADRLGTALQQQLRAAEDSSRKLRRLLDASGDIGDVGQGRVLSTS